MSAKELDELLDRMPDIAAALEKFASVEIQGQVFQALMNAFGVDASAGEKGESEDEKVIADDSARLSEDAVQKQRKRAARKNATRVKQSFSIDKGLDLVGNARMSFKEFCAEKQPKSFVEKCLVAVYWLTRVSTSTEPATLDRVYTCFKHMTWQIPNNFANTIHQTGAKGWLDSGDRENLTVVTNGENHIEHEMPVDGVR